MRATPASTTCGATRAGSTSPRPPTWRSRPRTTSTRSSHRQYPVTGADHAQRQGHLRRQRHPGPGALRDQGARRRRHTCSARRCRHRDRSPIIPAGPVADPGLRAEHDPFGKLTHGWPSAARPAPVEANASETTTRTPGWSATPRRSRWRSGWGTARQEKPIYDKTGGTVWGSGIPSTYLAQLHDRGRPRP